VAAGEDLAANGIRHDVGVLGASGGRGGDGQNQGQGESPNTHGKKPFKLNG